MDQRSAEKRNKLFEEREKDLVLKKEIKDKLFINKKKKYIKKFI